MKKLRISPGNRCPERGCVVRDQPQHFAKAWLSGIFHALRLVFDTAALLSVALTTSSLLLLCPASAHVRLERHAKPVPSESSPDPDAGPKLRRPAFRPSSLSVKMRTRLIGVVWRDAS